MIQTDKARQLALNSQQFSRVISVVDRSHAKASTVRLGVGIGNSVDSRR